MRGADLGQRWRAAVLCVYFLALLGASWALSGDLLPPASEKGIWFYSGAAALLLGSLLVSPYFTKPADAISNAVAALLVLAPVSPWVHDYGGSSDSMPWFIATGFSVGILAAGLTAVLLKDVDGDSWKRVAVSATQLVDTLGSPRVVFSVVYFFAVYAFHRSSALDLLIIGGFWAVCVGLRPLEGLLTLVRRWRLTWAGGDAVALGSVIGHESPDVVLFRTERPVDFGTVVLARSSDAKIAPAVVLDMVGYADGVWLRALLLPTEARESMALGQAGALVRRGQVVLYQADRQSPLSTIAADLRDRLVGLVGADSDLGHIEVELARHDLPIVEGSLVEAAIRNEKVLYQVTRGVTKEELVELKNRRAFIRVRARRIGIWSTRDERFEPSQWLPQPNTPVTLSRVSAGSPSSEAIGRFPGTPYPVRFDLNYLVTHNTAILGVLGIGKSFLAIELVERLIASDVKVLCLDLTDEYRRIDRLGQFIKSETQQTWDNDLATAASAAKARVAQNVEDGGSRPAFRAAVRAQLGEFIENELVPLRVVNPGRLDVWRQDSRPYQGAASMASLSPTEIARIFTEEMLAVLQEKGVSDRARVCIVYEEAHSLVPEFNSIAFEGDKEATNGTAKALLQGRKFGMGCLLVTQRTANVSKTVLSQCNTVVAMRMFDSTAMDYLANFVGQDTARLVPTLPDRVAVVFGRASSCPDPVIVRLNDREDFLQSFRREGAQAEVGVGTESARQAGGHVEPSTSALVDPGSGEMPQGEAAKDDGA